MFYFVYILKSLSSQQEWFYIGCTKDLEKRLIKHNKGLVKSTKYYKPFQVVFYKSFKTLSEARRFEDYLKSPKGYLEKLSILNKKSF